MAQNDGVYVFDSNSRADKSSDLLALAALNGGGFGGMNNPLWMMFMWPMLYPMMSMFGGYGGWGNGFGNGMSGAAGTGYIANQLNNDTGRELIVQALNGRADALSQLAQLTNQSVSSVKDAIAILGSKLTEVGGQIGISGLQVISELKSGNAAIAQKLCECCCENRLAIEKQTNALQAQAAGNHAATTLQLANNAADIRLQLAQNEAADQLSVCQQTNQLGSQAERNANSILGAIKDQNALLEQKFCEIKEREMQSKIDTQGDIITQLRGQISNDKQTESFNAAINALNEKIALLAAKQPNTVPVQYPNIQAVNTTPWVGGYPQTGFFN